MNVSVAGMFRFLKTDWEDWIIAERRSAEPPAVFVLTTRTRARSSSLGMF